jgi:diguanylate cyclase (GGDEF)-like protein
VPSYYRSVLVLFDIFLCINASTTFLLSLFVCGQFTLIPLVMIGLIVLAHYVFSRLRTGLMFQMALTLLWCFWNIHSFGWSVGGQHFLMPMLVILFFSVYETPIRKILGFVLLIVFRMGIFGYSVMHQATISMSSMQSILLQTVNSLTVFALLAGICIIFSSNIQQSERKLLILNQKLQKDAETDVLTHLPNRRSLKMEMEEFIRLDPSRNFSISIADIDFFKKVNDTYGHNCGDYVLVELSKLFLKWRDEKGFCVCRWGGEEFCFFLFDRNIDEAGIIIQDLCREVERMPLSFEGHDFNITITAGVEENDFHSSLEELLDKADVKLYMGKQNGRNRVVV